MMIWLWRIPNTWPNKRIGTVNKKTGTDRFEFMKGKKLSTDGIVCPDIVFECQEKFLYDVLPNSGSMLIVSKRVLDIMETICKDDYQSFEANVFVGKNKVDGYYLLNISNKLEILDKEKSIFTTIDNSSAILGIEKIVYNQEELINHNIVRNADYLSHVVVSQKIKDVFEKEKIKGVEFRLEE